MVVGCVAFLCCYLYYTDVHAVNENIETQNNPNEVVENQSNSYEVLNIQSISNGQFESYVLPSSQNNQQETLDDINAALVCCKTSCEIAQIIAGCFS